MTPTVIPTTFSGACTLIRNARMPESLFGTLTGLEKTKERQEAAERLRTIFRKLAFLVHPDKNPASPAASETAFRKLESLRARAEALIGAAGPPQEEPDTFTSVSFATPKHSYVLTGVCHEGGTATLFKGVVSRKGAVDKVFVKVPHSADDNDLMEREARSLALLQKKAKGLGADAKGRELSLAFLSHFPPFLESLQLEEPNAAKKKTVNTFLKVPDHETGWYSLEAIRGQYPQGVSTRIATFIWNRILEGLMFAHTAGLAHGALTPNHVIIHADDHLGIITDWTASCRIGEAESIPYLEARYRTFFPTELLAPEGRATARSDIYMSAWLIVYILGGEPKDRYVPQSVEEPFRELLNRCVQPTPRLRPALAEEVFTELGKVSRKLFGPKKFVPLIMKPET